MPTLPVDGSPLDIFATVEDLATRLQRTFSAAETDAAEQALGIATDAIRTFTRQTLSRVDDDELVLDADAVFELWLPERPVIDLTSITFGGTTVAASTYSWRQNGRIRFPAGLGYFGEHGYYVASSDQQATILYSHGFDPLPRDIQGVCLDLVESAVQLPDVAGVAQEQIGNYSVTFDHQKAGALTATHERQLEGYRPKITSAPIVVGL